MPDWTIRKADSVRGASSQQNSLPLLLMGANGFWWVNFNIHHKNWPIPRWEGTQRQCQSAKIHHLYFIVTETPEGVWSVDDWLDSVPTNEIKESSLKSSPLPARHLATIVRTGPLQAVPVPVKQYVINPQAHCQGKVLPFRRPGKDWLISIPFSPVRSVDGQSICFNMNECSAHQTWTTAIGTAHLGRAGKTNPFFQTQCEGNGSELSHGCLHASWTMSRFA